MMSYANLKHTELQAEVRRRQIPGRSKLTTKAAMAAALEEDDRIKGTGLSKAPEQKKTIVPEEKKLIRPVSDDEIRDVLVKLGLISGLPQIVTDYSKQRHAAVWKIESKDFFMIKELIRDGEESDPKGLALAEKEMINLGMSPRRGDIVIIADPNYERDGDLLKLLFDGQKLVVPKLDVDGNEIVPEEFNALSEFPIDYWSETGVPFSSVILFEFDHSKFLDQLLKNIEYKLIDLSQKDQKGQKDQKKNEQEDGNKTDVYALITSFVYKGQPYELISEYAPHADQDKHKIDEESLPDVIEIFKQQLKRRNQNFSTDSVFYLSKPNRIFILTDDDADNELSGLLGVDMREF